jgi:glucosamine kinase
MILIVDSGSTKADWMFIKKNGEKILHQTMGFNPYFHDHIRIALELNLESFTSVIPLREVEKIYFYGAGCPDDFYKDKMRNSLAFVFPKASIEVAHDLLGAARAACGKSPGIAAILGTGSNSCLYDGKNIIDNIPALAHVLGDEGGGVHLGKLTLQAYFYRELPSDLLDAFHQMYPIGQDDIIHKIYSEGQNVYLASFAQFLVKYREHPFAKSLIKKSFNEFISRHVKKYKNAHQLPINFVGSIADILKHELSEVMEEEKLLMGKIIRKPIEALAQYHEIRT